MRTDPESGQRYLLVRENLSADDHRIHLHRHSFEVRQVSGSIEMQGLNKDVVPDHAKSTTEVEFLLNNPEKTLFHYHLQDQNGQRVHDGVSICLRE